MVLSTTKYSKQIYIYNYHMEAVTIEEICYVVAVKKFDLTSGGSRIFPRGVRQFPNWDYFQNERIWTPGGRVPGAPLRSVVRMSKNDPADLKKTTWRQHVHGHNG